jgi:hypothetical protein
MVRLQGSARHHAVSGGGYVGPVSPRNALARWTREHQSDKPPRRKDPIVAEFRDRVNMTRSELLRWLLTKRSHEVGQKRRGQDESVGHASGRCIVELLGKRRSEPVSAGERAHMRKVIGYIKRHSAQRPEGDVRDTSWRASLRNWGHDTLKD